MDYYKKRIIYYKKRIIELIQDCDNERCLRLIYIFASRLLKPQEEGVSHES